MMNFIQYSDELNEIAQENMEALKYVETHNGKDYSADILFQASMDTIRIINSIAKREYGKEYYSIDGLTGKIFPPSENGLITP